MNYLETDGGRRILKAYLSKFKGKSSQKIYKSEIVQFFQFYDGNLDNLNHKVFIKYRNLLDQRVTGKTIKRKISILNVFFKFVQNKKKGFKSPIGGGYGDLVKLQSRNYAESDNFQSNLVLFKESLVCESTKKTYGYHIVLFFQWVKQSIKDLKQSDFIRYRDYLVEESGLKASTVWVKFIAINRFLKFIAAKNRNFKNPLAFNDLKLVPPKKDKGYYTIIKKSDIKKLLSQPDRRTLIGKRDYAILRLMLTYGLRVNEVAKLKYQDIQGERVKGQQKIIIRDRKGRIGRRPDTPIILNGKVLFAWDLWLDNCGINYKPDTPIFAGFIWDVQDGGLIINYSRVIAKKQLSVKALENMVDKYVKRAGLDYGDKVLSAHAFRHTALTMLAKAGVDLIDLKKLAGHQDVSTTMIYIHSVQSYDDHVGMYSPINN